MRFFQEICNFIGIFKDLFRLKWWLEKNGTHKNMNNFGTKRYNFINDINKKSLFTDNPIKINFILDFIVKKKYLADFNRSLPTTLEQLHMVIF